MMTVALTVLPAYGVGACALPMLAVPALNMR